MCLGGFGQFVQGPKLVFGLRDFDFDCLGVFYDAFGLRLGRWRRVRWLWGRDRRGGWGGSGGGGGMVGQGTCPAVSIRMT